jgi:hypothetical protein
VRWPARASVGSDKCIRQGEEGGSALRQLAGDEAARAAVRRLGRQRGMVVRYLLWPAMA